MDETDIRYDGAYVHMWYSSPSTRRHPTLISLLVAESSPPSPMSPLVAEIRHSSAVSSMHSANEKSSSYTTPYFRELDDKVLHRNSLRTPSLYQNPAQVHGPNTHRLNHQTSVSWQFRRKYLQAGPGESNHKHDTKAKPGRYR